MEPGEEITVAILGRLISTARSNRSGTIADCERDGAKGVHVDLQSRVREFDQMTHLEQQFTFAMNHIKFLEGAFDAQASELRIACKLMTPDQLAEFRRRAYPSLYPSKEVL